MKKIIFMLLASLGIVLAQPVTFKDYGAIWVCKGDYWVAANRRAKKVHLTNERLKISSWLYYDANQDLYRSRDGKHTLKYRGNDLDGSDVSFTIDGDSYKCMYEYMERG